MLPVFKYLIVILLMKLLINESNHLKWNRSSSVYTPKENKQGTGVRLIREKKLFDET